MVGEEEEDGHYTTDGVGEHGPQSVMSSLVKSIRAASHRQILQNYPDLLLPNPGIYPTISLPLVPGNFES